jgi:CRISPR-associated protein Cmr3
MWVFIEPFDVWMFRDGKPFTAGEQTRATGFFPPLPTTFQGVIRTAGLVRDLGAAGRSFADFNAAQRGPGAASDTLVDRWGSGASDFGRFRMRGPFVARERDGRQEVLLPAPRDLLSRESKAGAGAGNIFVVVRPKRLEAGRVVRGGLGSASMARDTAGDPLVSAQWPPALELPLPEAEAPDKLEEGPAFLPVGTFAKYLTGVIDGESAPRELERDVLKRDVLPDLRVGIQRDRRRGTVEHGRLYLAHFQRPAAGVGLVAEVSFASKGNGGGAADAAESPLADSGVLGVGGEARAGRYRKLAESPLAAIESEDFRATVGTKLRGSRFKLVLVTPAVFPHGWCPGFIDPSTLRGHLLGTQLSLVAAVVGKPLPVTGWDYAARGPKGLQWAVPAGSTYTFEVLEASGDWAQRLIQEVHGRSIDLDHSGTRRPGTQIGMALAFVSVA